MASSTLIRGRRVVDPVPVQRGSLFRDGKRSSSFSDLAAAWENVGEAKSALEAAEARINEANAGISRKSEKEQEPVDLPLQEIFSETQRYGRVTRYELRPSSYSRAAPTAAPFTGEDRQSRRMLDFASNTEGHRLPRGMPRQPAGLSPPSRDIHSTLANGRITTDPYSAVQSHSGQIGNAVPSLYSSTANNQRGRADVLSLSGVSQNHNVPVLGSLSSFDDSLEAPRTSAARAEVRSSSSLGLKAAMSNKSVALARLKERIQQQKEQAFRHSRESVQETDNSESRSPRLSSRRDDYHANGFTGHYRAGDDIPQRATISKRKVASAPAPPAYKGFSEMDSRTVVTASELKRKVKGKEPDLYNGDVKSGKQRPQKPFQNGAGPRVKKGPPKVQRVLAPRRPTDVITTSSWRTGQQTVKRVLGPVKKKKSSPPGSRPRSSSSQDTDESEMKGLNFQWEADDASKKDNYLDSDSEKVSNQFDAEKEKNKLPTEIGQKRDVLKHGRDLDIEPIKLSSEADTDKDADIDSDPPDMKELRGSKTLSKEAKNILSDLDLDSDDSDQQVKHSAPDSKPKQNLMKKSPKKRKLAPQQEVVYPTQKVRHYDAEEVKKYMAKQIADRKKRLKEDRLMKQKAVEERKKKLEELYNKQKKNLSNNLARRDKNVMGETYSKGFSDKRSIINPYSRPFNQDEGEYNSEDTGITESDKENLDIASFKGLPIYSSSRTKYRTTDERDRGSSASSAYDGRRDSSVSPDRDSVTHEGDESQVPRVTSVSVVTRKTDLRPSAYIGFPEDSFESDRDGARADDSMSRDDLQPRSSSPHEAVLGTGRAKPPGSPPRDDRIAALKQTAAQLKQRLESEARRLGIDLQAGVPGDEDDGLRTTGPAAGHTVFNGPLPGVGNLHDQADLNKELEAMTSAATTIQAAYRGHSVRQGLNWKLPSGQTLRSTVRQARYQKSATTAGPAASADVSEPSQYSTAWETVITNEDKSISEAPTLPSSSSFSKLSKSSRSAKVDKLSSITGSSVHKSDKPRVVKGHSEVVKSSVPPWRSAGGDSLSVINIFARKNPHLKLPPVEDVWKESDTAETPSILVETTPRKRAAGDTASLLEPLNELNQSGELLEQTLVAGSPDTSREHEYEDDFTGSQTMESMNSRHEGSGKRTLSPDKNADETAAYSESFVSSDTSLSEHKTKSPVNHSLQSGPLSPTLSEGELSHASDVVERSQAVSPVRRSPTEQREIPSSSYQSQPPTRLPPPVFYPGSEGGSRISPGSLDQRLTAELNRLEYMEESVRQLTDVERTRSVALAQQETVSLAQILKSKQLTHAREMENLRAKAREEALESAKQLEQARQAAANAAAEAAETISRMRLETVASISESADRLLKVQTEAARTTAESAKQVEEARSSAARTLLEVAQQQVTDTRGVAADAASAAAEAAVKSTMARYYEQQEQIYKERNALRKRYRDDSGDEHDRTRDSYSRYTHSEPTNSYSRSRSTRSVTEALDRSGRSPGTGSYTSDDFEYTRGSRKDKTESVHTASNLSANHSESHSHRRITPTPSVPATRSRNDSSLGEETGSIPEEMEHSVADSVVSDIALDEAEDQSLVEALTVDTNKKSNDRREISLADEDYTLNFEESVMSSHTATDDEIDYRMILPSESHRRRSLGKTGRSGSSVGSDPGTVSYSSDDNHDSQDLRLEKALEDISAAPFSAEDSFSQFTSEMVRLMKEEEVRAKHQEGLLRLREKALKEKTRAEMAWLELQKQRHRDKGADDVMPSIRKRQRGVLMRLQAEQAEIKRLKAANRAASCERRLLLMQQEEIARLRKSTKKIRQSVAAERTEPGNHEEEVKPAAKIAEEQPKSEADSTEVQEELEGQAGEKSSRNRSVISEDINTASPAGTANVAEELPGYQSSGRTQSFPSYGSRESGTRERKRCLSEGESDEGSAAEGQHSAAKGSPSASDSTVMQKLKKLRSQSSERYLTQREQKLMKRRKEAESLLENKKKLLEWERRLDKEENLVRNLLNEALSLERTKARTTSITSEEDEQKDRSGRVSGSLSVSRSPSSKVSEKDRSTQRTESISESIKPESPGHQRSASESSVPEDITVSARDKSHDVSRDTEKSRDSSIPELEMKTRSQGSSIPEEIPEEYVNDTFESIDSTTTPNHSTPVRSDLSIKRDPSPTVSRTSSKDDGSKSEEEASMTETSDHSDIESRVRRLKDQLELRKREVKRLYNERKRQRKAMLRAQEASLRKELQAVEMVISRTKAELNRPQVDSARLDSAAAEHRPTPTKGDSGDSASLREVRYRLSRTSDISGGRNVTPTDKETLSSKRGSAGGEGPSVVNVEETVSSASSLRDGRSSPVKSRDSSFVSETKMDELPEKEKSLVGSEVETDRKTDNNLSERSRSSDGSLSPGLRKASHSELNERKSPISERSDSKEDIKEEVRTAEDVSLDEGSESRSRSEASLHEKSIEERSQSVLESLSGSHRESSESARGRSLKERRDSDAHTEAEVKSLQDYSVSERSESQSQSKVSVPETSFRDDFRKSAPDVTDGQEESRASRSGRSSQTSERKSGISETSEASRVSEKPRNSKFEYSVSFESVSSDVGEKEKGETDISEHISAEEDSKENEISEAVDSENNVHKPEKNAQETKHEEEEAKAKKKTQSESEISEELVSAGKDDSEVEDQLSEADEALSVNEREKIESYRDKNLLKPPKVGDQLSSYSADFESSVDDEKEDEEKSESSTPRASYVPDFEDAESEGVEEREKSERMEGGRELSVSEQQATEGRYSAGKSEEVGERYLSEQLEDKSREKTTVVEQVADDESIAEEISGIGEDLEEYSDQEGSHAEKREGERLVSSQHENEERVSSEEKTIRRDQLLPAVSFMTGTTQEKRSSEETAERIADDLSAMLLKESLNCVTVMFESRRKNAEVLPEPVASSAERSREDGTKATFTGGKEMVLTKEAESAISEPSDEISEHVGYSEDEESVSGLDFRTEGQNHEVISDQTEQLQKESLTKQESREARGNAIVLQFSEALLQEAAAQMIAIMRSRKEKLSALPPQPTAAPSSVPEEVRRVEPHSSDDESPLSSPRSNRFMAVQRFPEGMPKYAEETPSPLGSPTKLEVQTIDEKELAEKLDQLRRLHEHLDSAREIRHDEEDNRLEFNVVSNSIIEFPSQDEEEEDEGFRRSRGASFLFSVPHREDEVASVVASSLLALFNRKRRGLPIDNVTPPSEIIGDSEPGDDLEANSKRVYRRLVFDLSASVFKELLMEETPSHRPSWMKTKRRRRRRFHRTLEPLVDERDFRPVVEQQVLNLIGLGEARPSLETVRRKTPLKAGKKDLVDAILIQELREDEPLWVDYDDDELAVKFQVADAIFESLLSETVMVMNAVQLRQEARADVFHS